MRLLFTVLITLLFYSFNFSQDNSIQWANKVLEVSSEFTYEKHPTQYVSKNVLGYPNTDPLGQANPAAWCPKTKSSDKEFILVSFQKPMAIQQVLINESFGAGTISHVYLIDTDNNSHLVHRDSLFATTDAGRLLQVTFDRTDFLVQQVRVEMNTSKIDGYNQIDAIGIADHQILPKTFVRTEKIVETPEKIPLDENINSTNQELLPVITPDGKQLFFTRENHPENIAPETQEIWMSTIDENKLFSKAINVGAPLNHSRNSSLISITPDGNQALVLNVYNPDGTFSSGYSMTKKTINGWSTPVQVPIEDYYNDSKFGEATLSNTGNTIILAVQRKDGKGSKDLYVTHRDSTGNWTKPLNLGEINTVGSETAPFLASDDRTLYFATDGYPGYGGKDVFVTRRIGDGWTDWTEPTNLGAGINTEGFDAYYTVPASGEFAYFVNTISKGNTDIFRVKLPEALRPQAVTLVKGTVFNTETNEPISTSINYYNLNTGKLVGTAYSNPEDGAYQIVLPSGNLYGFTAQKEGFIGISENLRIDSSSTYQEIERNLYLSPIKKGTRIRVNNIYFDFAKASLRSESFVELDQITSIMKSNPNMKVIIEGHTDDRGDDNYNLKLSEKRANSVVDYLISKGISSSRLKSIGHGEKIPAKENSSDENRQFNRRVEFVIETI